MVLFLLLKVSPPILLLERLNLILYVLLFSLSLSLLSGLDYLFPEDLVITFPSDRDRYVMATSWVHA